MTFFPPPNKIPTSFPFPIVDISAEMRQDLSPFLEKISRHRLIPRLWEKDWTLWKDEPSGIADRLGWLEAPEKSAALLPEIKRFAALLGQEGFRHALLLGMGGSSLAPEVLSRLFDSTAGFLDLHVLDSTVPAAVITASRLCPPGETLYVVSSKSGTTSETRALFHYFFTLACKELGKEVAPSHFTAITDPGTPLESAASSLGFRQIWLSDPAIGGRFSALSPFGLVPAALKGINIESLLASSRRMKEACQEETPFKNPGALIASFLTVAAAKGRDKLLLWIEPELNGFGDWLEQLLAESTGKEGRGLLPVIGREELLDIAPASDAAFIWLGASSNTPVISSIKERLYREGTPAIFLAFHPQNEIGGMFFLWEWAIALASSFLKINPFDQPDVEKTKQLTQAMLQELREKGAFPEERGSLGWRGIKLISPSPTLSFHQTLADFLTWAQGGSYLALQAFLPPEPGIKKLLLELTYLLIRLTRRPVTLGWGPRYLHSTGQLHKGDCGRGFFLQLSAEDLEDVTIPDEPGAMKGWLTFGLLKEAQARGDYEALVSLGRKILRLHLGRDICSGIEELRSFIQELFPGKTR